jgi:hypothetical protein
MENIVSIVIAGLSLVVSVFAFWQTSLHKGKVKMTKPTIVALAFDGIKGPPKVFLRMLLYNTSKQGAIIETMFLEIESNGVRQVFEVWGYGLGEFYENGREKLVKGSGMYVSEQGVAYNHHFVAARNREYIFSSGVHTIKVYAIIKGKKTKLSEIEVEVTEELAATLAKQTLNVLFDWSYESKSYIAQLEKPSGDILAYLLR